MNIRTKDYKTKKEMVLELLSYTSYKPNERKLNAKIKRRSRDTVLYWYKTFIDMGKRQGVAEFCFDMIIYMCRG